MRDGVKLRGHHLLCILTYKGKGYTPAFEENFGEILEQINQGAEIEIAEGADDICAALRHGAEITCAHAKVCRSATLKHRDRLALIDVSRALQFPHLKKGDRLKLGKGEIKHLRQHFLHGANRRACTGCSWHDFCTGIARSKFDGVKLLPKAVP